MTVPDPQPSVPGVPPLPFDQLTREQAQAHLDAYVAGMPERRRRLEQVVADRGGPTGALDDSPASLDALWAWYRGAPHRLEPPWSPEDEGLPIWLPHTGHRSYSTELLVDLDLLSAYAAAVVQGQDPSAEWAVGSAPKRQRYIWQHEPVLRPRTSRELNPRHQIGTSLHRVLVTRKPTGYESLHLA